MDPYTTVKVVEGIEDYAYLPCGESDRSDRCSAVRYREPEYGMSTQRPSYIDICIYGGLLCGLIKKNIHMDRVKRSTVLTVYHGGGSESSEDKPDISTLNLEKEKLSSRRSARYNEVTVRENWAMPFCIIRRRQGSNLVLLSDCTAL